MLAHMADPAATESPGAPGAFQATDTGRVEAFSDGVFAVAITILALELATPAHRDGGLLFQHCCTSGRSIWAI
jgi:hypothetical protein